MRSPVVVKAISCVMLAVFPLSTFAAETGVAVVYPDRAINLNGSLLEKSQAVVDGDQLRTQSGGATIALNGATLQMGAESEVVFHPAAARVVSGSLAVTTSRGLGAEAVNVRVEPATPSARYLITETNGKLVVAAVEGSVRVSDGKTTVTVEQNKALVAKLEPMAMPKAAGPQDDNNKKKQTGGAIPAAGVGVTLSKAELVGIAAIAAIIGAALALVLTSRQPVSGSH